MFKSRITIISIAVFSLIACQAFAVPICLDPSGPRSISGCGVNEENLTLAIINELKPMLAAAGHTVYQTRTNGNSVTAASRASYCNSHGVSVTFSAVANAYTSSTAKGVESYYNGKGSSGTLAQRFIKQASSDMGLTLRSANQNSTHGILTQANHAAVEGYLGFITNCGTDVPAMKNTFAYAQSICRSILAVYGGNANACNRAYRIAGKVVSSDGRPIAGATVTVSHLDKALQTTTDANGNWQFESLVEGAYRFNASASNYNSGNQSCTVSSTSGNNPENCKIVLPPIKGTLTGRVIDRETGLPIASAALQYSPFLDGPSQSNQSGAWSASGTPGNYTISAETSIYEANSVHCTLVSNATTPCPDIQLSPKPGWLKGTVKCKDSLIPASIIVDGTTYQTESGEWQSEKMTHGTYAVKVIPKNDETGTATCKAMETSCVVNRGQANACDVILASVEPGTLSVVVSDSGTKKSIPAEIAIIRTSDNAVLPTGSYGGGEAYRVPLEPGTYLIQASNPNYHPMAEARSCTITENQLENCDIELDPIKAQICVSVRDVRDNAQQPAKITLLSDDDTPLETLDLIKPKDCFQENLGNFTVKVEASYETCQFDVKTQHAEILPNQNVDLEFHVDCKSSATTRLVGEVVSSDDKNAKIPATVTLILDQTEKTTDYDGTTNWNFDVPPGAYTVKAVAKGHDKFFPGEKYCQTSLGLCSIALQPHAEDVPTLGDDQENSTPTLWLQTTGESCQATTRQQTSTHSLWLILFTLCTVAAWRRKISTESK